MITQLRNAGLNVVRMNFSHGTHEVSRIYLIKEKVDGKGWGIMGIFDLPGDPIFVV